MPLQHMDTPRRLWHHFWMHWHLFFDEFEAASRHWVALGKPKLKTTPPPQPQR